MDLRSDLARLVDRNAPEDGIRESPLAGTQCMKFSHPTQRAKSCWGSSLCIVAQGCKEIVLGRAVYRSEDAHYIATPIDLPVTSRVASASPEKPFLCLKLALDPMLLSEVHAQIERDSPGEPESLARGVFVGRASDRMLEAAIRLGELFQTPEDIPVLGPLIIKEIFYHLLKGADGPAIRQLVRSGSKLHRISQAIYALKTDLSDALDVNTLAEAAGMSRSAFFKHFKEVTSLSPIQYQKRLRLLEARRLMIEEGETAEGSAFQVGYKSASQFSREYSRMFGIPPFKHAVETRQTARAADVSDTAAAGA